MALFTFTLASFGITNTRSKHEDTDYVAFTLRLGSLDPQTVFKPMGNVNNGTHQVELSFNGIEVDQDDTVLFNYLIVNAGSATEAQVESELRTVGAAWANGQGPTPPQMTSALGADLAWFNSELKGILKSTCDGMVAAEQSRFLYGDLLQLIPSNIVSHQTVHAGTHSPSGCGNNSQYTVNWQAAKVTLVPDVIGYATDTPGSHPVKLYASPTLQKAGFATAWEHGTTGPLVVRQNPPGDLYAVISSPVTLWRGTVVP
jgi:hypothetical protein